MSNSPFYKLSSGSYFYKTAPLPLFLRSQSLSRKFVYEFIFLYQLLLHLTMNTCWIIKTKKSHDFLSFWQNRGNWKKTYFSALIGNFQCQIPRVSSKVKRKFIFKKNLDSNQTVFSPPSNTIMLLTIYTSDRVEWDSFSIHECMKGDVKSCTEWHQITTEWMWVVSV